jgi:hypothetical protein
LAILEIIAAPTERASQNDNDLMNAISFPLYFASPTPQSCINLPVMIESDKLKQMLIVAIIKAKNKSILCLMM